MTTEIKVCDASYEPYAEAICKMMSDAAKVRGTGIAERKPEYVATKMANGNAIIALDGNKVAGFCYIERWEGKKMIANSGLIVHPDYRKTGLAKKIKQAAFKLSREKYPHSKIFGITTSLAVMKINSDLGYKPVTFSELTKDEQFWQGCQTCVNYDILQRTNRDHCLCTGMIYTPAMAEAKKTVPKKDKWEKFKQFIKVQRQLFQRKSANKVKSV